MPMDEYDTDSGNLKRALQYRRKMLTYRRNRDWEMAFQMANAGASEGDMQCMAWQAFSYESGLGVEKNPEEAYLIAQKLMGKDYFDGFAIASRLVLTLKRPICEIDCIKSRLLAFTEMGNQGAYADLGVLCKSLGDSNAALKFFETGSELGEPWSCYYLAHLLKEKSSASEDLYRANRLIKFAASNRIVEAMFETGAVLLKRKSRKAMRWLEAAAKAGHANASFFVGVLLMTKGNIEAGVHHLEVARNRGSKDAEETLIEMREALSGVKRV